MTKFKKKSAFTLVELLVVIAIIGILSTLAVVALQSSRADSRDAKRLADVRQMQKALEMYFLENGTYPSDISSGIASGSAVYMAQVPVAPTPADGSCTSEYNSYIYSSTGSSYTLDFCLGSKTGEIDSGFRRATNEGIISYTPPVPFVCGATFTDPRDFQEYPTIQMGSQCWMAKNLAYLPSVQNDSNFVVLGSSNSPAYGVYGYSGEDVSAAKATSNYGTYGVLYNWYAAIATSSTTGTEGLQGVCPSGWHIPTQAEQTNLYNILNNEVQYRCDGVSGAIAKAMSSASNWTDYGTNCTIGNNQQTNNSSGFNIFPAGGRMYNNGSFHSINSASYVWSSSFSGSNAVYIYFLYFNSTIYSGGNKPISGASVRCIKD